MAVEEYAVINIETNSLLSPKVREWSGGAANTGIDDSLIKKAEVFYVKAESTAEAIRGVKQLYGGSVNGKLQAIKKSTLTEE